MFFALITYSIPLNNTQIIQRYPDDAKAAYEIFGPRMDKGREVTRTPTHIVKLMSLDYSLCPSAGKHGHDHEGHGHDPPTADPSQIQSNINIPSKFHK